MFASFRSLEQTVAPTPPSVGTIFQRRNQQRIDFIKINAPTHREGLGMIQPSALKATGSEDAVILCVWLIVILQIVQESLQAVHSVHSYLLCPAAGVTFWVLLISSWESCGVIFKSSHIYKTYNTLASS